MALVKTGAHDISTLMAARFQSVVEFGLDTIEEVLNADLAAHNEIVNDLVGELAVPTTDRQRIYGESTTGDMIAADEYTRGPTKVVRPGSTVGFPLNRFQYAIGWTNTWMEEHSPMDMAIAVKSGQKAHLRKIQEILKKAFFLSTNYTHQDHLKDNVDLAVKRLLNADGQPIPEGPHGETFDGGTHTHYNGTASFVVGDITAQIEDVVEHGHGGSIRLCINRGEETAVRAFTGFQEYTDPRLILGTEADKPGKRLDITRLDNRAIGILGAAEIWVKPWVPATYTFCYDRLAPKPLVFRQNERSRMRGLRIVATIPAFPLLAQFMESDFDFGVWTRTNGVALDTGNASYTDPVL